MTVEELFRKLSYGELSNLAVAVDSTGTIKKEKQNQVIDFINEGLEDLHGRYAIRQSEEILTLGTADIEQALSDETLNVLSILTAWGQPIPFRNNKVPDTVYVYDRVLFIPTLIGAQELQVTYQLRHVPLDPITSTADLAQEVTLPREWYKALRCFVAAEMFGLMNTPEAMAASAGFRQKFQQACFDASPGDTDLQSKFHQRGWT